MKRPQKKFSMVVSIALVFVVSTISPVIGYIEVFGYEDQNYNNWAISKVKVPAHAVYADTDQAGVTSFGVWIMARNHLYTWFGTLINVYIYISAEYKETTVNFKTRTSSTRYYWAPPPENLLVWSGDYDYGSSVPTQYTYSVGATAYGFSTGRLVTGNPYSNYASGSGTSGEFRYLGWLQSIYEDGQHEFSALLKLHVVNAIATEWANGVSEEEFPILVVTEIINLRVQLVFKYYTRAFWWGHQRTHVHTMGDGIGVEDLAYIPLVVGSVP